MEPENGARAMPEGNGGSTVPRRQLGRELRRLREIAQLTAKDAADQAGFSKQKLWRIEGAETPTTPADAGELCRLYGASPEMTDALRALARETKAKGWWQAYSDVIPETFAVYVGLEAAAKEISQYTTELVPGLLQTEAYARDLITTDNPAAPDSEVERRLHVRLNRQGLLRRAEPPALDFILNESILRRPIASGGVMAEQLRHLADVGEADNVSIRVIPFSVGTHHGVTSGPFVLLRFPPEGLGPNPEPTTVYMEGYTGSLYLDKPAEIERFETAFASIASKALDPAGSRDLITSAAKEMDGP